MRIDDRRIHNKWMSDFKCREIRIKRMSHKDCTGCDDIQKTLLDVRQPSCHIFKHSLGDAGVTKTNLVRITEGSGARTP